MTRTALHVSLRPAFEAASIKPAVAPGVLKDGSAKMPVIGDPGRITRTNAGPGGCIGNGHAAKPSAN